MTRRWFSAVAFRAGWLWVGAFTAAGCSTSTPAGTANRYGEIVTVSRPAGAAPRSEQATDPASASDRLKALQTAAVAGKAKKAHRPYHFGSQGPGDVFSKHASHTNRLVPFYVFGRNANLGAVTGRNSVYRHRDKLKALYGALPENTHNPEADYADQTDFYRVQRDAIKRGVKHLFIVWFDGLDWPTTLAAAVAKTGKIYSEGKGSGLVFQDYNADGSAQFGYYVTSPTADKNAPDLDEQTVKIHAESLRGGYDARIAGPNPWTLGPLGAKAPGYLRGQLADARDRATLKALSAVVHPFTDSAPSAAAFVSGQKAYNNGINVRDDGTLTTTLFHEFQADGWKVGTVTSVPFDHASPAAMYAHNVHRDDYQDLGREMLGLPSITQQKKKEPVHPGLDVVIGTGFGQETNEKTLKALGKNGVAGNLYLTDADRSAIDVAHGGKYVVVHTEPGRNGAQALRAAASRSAGKGERLFGFFGSKTLNHLPYRTADGRYDPAPDLDGKTETYTKTELDEQPTLADMTEAALTVLGADPKQPFALFVEAGDVDFALHKNNLDNAIGAVYSGEDAVRAILSWVETHSNWDDSLLIVTADHGHYLVLDDLEALAARR